MNVRDRKIVSLYERGLTMSEIGRRCGGISKQAVDQILRRLAVPRRPKPEATKRELSRERRLAREVATRELHAAVLQLIKKGGITYAEIGLRLGVSGRRVTKIAARYGVGPGKGGHGFLAWKTRRATTSSASKSRRAQKRRDVRS